MSEGLIIQPITVTIATACKMTGIGRSTVYRLISDGTLATTRIGTRRLVLFKSLLLLVKEQQSGARPTSLNHSGKVRHT